MTPRDKIPTVPPLVEALLVERPASSDSRRAAADKIPAGQRNSTLTSWAGSVRRCGGSEAEILSLIRQVNADRCEPPLPESDLTTIARSVARYEPATNIEGQPKQAFSPVIVNVGTVSPRNVEWLWPNRMPLGKVTLLAGEPGLGKSFLTMDLAARVTRGSAWPDDPSTRAPLGSVVLLSAEDDIADTIRPRLDAHDADVNKVVALQGIEFQSRESGTARRTFNLETDLPALEKAIADLADCRLVVIDPLSAYLGRKDSHVNAEIRSLLTPLAELASRYGVAVLGVTHLNKASGQKALHRFTGSMAFIAAARAGWLVAEDKDDAQRRLFLNVKCNLAQPADGLAFRIQEGRVAWEPGAVSVTADQALAVEPPKAAAATAHRFAVVDWLRDLLSRGPMPQRDVADAARGNGIAPGELRRAKERLGVQAVKEGFADGSRWVWSLPGSELVASLAPEDAREGAHSTSLSENQHLRIFEKTTEGVEDNEDAKMRVILHSESTHLRETATPKFAL